MRPLHRSLAGLLLTAAVSAACDPNPSGAQARAFYATHRGTIDAIDRDLRQSIAAAPEATSREPCTEATSECRMARSTSRAARFSARQRLQIDALRHLERRGVMGLELSARGPDDQGLRRWVAVGLTPGGYAHGRVLPSAGFSEGERRVGWGAYQTSFQRGSGTRYGDGNFHPGIEVLWDFDQGDTHFQARLFVLGRDQTDPTWRAGARARAGQ